MFSTNRQTEQEKVEIALAVDILLFATEQLVEVMQEIEGYANKSLLTHKEQNNLQLDLETSKLIACVARQKLRKIAPSVKASVYKNMDGLKREKKMKITVFGSDTSADTSSEEFVLNL